jgi:hypothetical protein
MKSNDDSYQAIKEGNHYLKLLEASFKKSRTQPTPPTPAPQT